MSKKRKIIILIIIINLILLIVLSVLFNNKKNNNQNNDSKVEDTKENDLTVVSPVGMYSFKNRYKGSLSEEFITGKMKKLLSYIISNNEIINEMDENDIQENYKQNVDKIELMGIENIDDYEQLIKNIKKLDNNNLIYEYCSLNISTMKANDEGVTLEYYIKFKDCEEISFDLELKDKYDAENMSLKFIPKK